MQLLVKALVSVKEHKRKTKSGGVSTVRAHTRNVDKQGMVAAIAKERVLIGRGNTGDVYREGHEVVKNGMRENGSFTGEGDVYRALEGAEGVARGYEKDGKIRLPHYPRVVSVDTIKPGDREKFGAVLHKNFARMAAAVNALSNAGYYYGDPLQFGLDAKGHLDLLDFSNCSRNGRDYQNFSDNMNLLGSFLREFGAPDLADRLGDARKAKSDLMLRHVFGTNGKLPEDEARHIDAAHEQLGGEADNAYYSEHPLKGHPSVPLKSGGYAVLTVAPLDDATIDRLGLVLVAHRAPRGDASH